MQADDNNVAMFLFILNSNETIEALEKQIRFSLKFCKCNIPGKSRHVHFEKYFY